MIKISDHISYDEATRSDLAKRLGIVNDPTPVQIQSMQEVATRVFEPLRDHFGVPIYISSFFRSPLLNKAVGGAPASQHLKGEAIDMDADNFGRITNKQIFDYIKDHLDFDQLIAEGIKTNGTPDWVHCSYVSPDRNRHDVLKMTIVNGQKEYETYV
jgi:zinc D-Ala-D-Ala carboxypeptidase